jgi:hypothetical protein
MSLNLRCQPKKEMTITKAFSDTSCHNIKSLPPLNLPREYLGGV